MGYRLNIKDKKDADLAIGVLLERVTGFEPVISTLGKLHVATTPNPHISF